MALALPFLGTLFKPLLAPGWHLYPCTEIRQDELMKLMLWEQIVEKLKPLRRGTQMFQR